jgi:hypothetical protein
LPPVIVATVLACAVLWATLLAVTVIDLGPLLAGDVNKPAGEMTPALADHRTAVLLVLPTAATN